MISRHRPEIISLRTKSGLSAPRFTKFVCPISSACPFRSMVFITASTQDTRPVMAVFAWAQKKKPKRSSSPAQSERLLKLNRVAFSLYCVTYSIFNAGRGHRMNIIEKIEREQLKLDVAPFKVGDTIRVHTRVVE